MFPFNLIPTTQDEDVIFEGNYFIAFDLLNMADVGMGQPSLCQYHGREWRGGGWVVRYTEFYPDGNTSTVWQCEKYVTERLRGRISDRAAVRLIRDWATARQAVA